MVVVESCETIAWMVGSELSRAAVAFQIHSECHSIIVWLSFIPQ